METHITSRAVHEQSRVLVLAPGSRGAGTGLCGDLLATDASHDGHVLRIVYDRDPDRIVDDWLEREGDLPESMAIVHPPSREPTGDLPDAVHATEVAPRDLTGVGIAVTRYLDRWDDGRPVTACLDSLTTLLQHVELKRAFRFLHTLNGRFTAAGARLHVHLDPETRDDQDVATLATLFDTVVTQDGEEWTVRQS